MKIVISVKHTLFMNIKLKYLQTMYTLPIVNILYYLGLFKSIMVGICFLCITLKKCIMLKLFIGNIKMILEKSNK